MNFGRRGKRPSDNGTTGTRTTLTPIDITAGGKPWNGGGEVDQQTAIEAAAQLNGALTSPTEPPLLLGHGVGTENGVIATNGGDKNTNGAAQAIDSQVDPEVPRVVPAPRTPVNDSGIHPTPAYRELRDEAAELFDDFREATDEGFRNPRDQRSFVRSLRGCVQTGKVLQMKARAARKARGLPQGLSDEERAAAAKEHAEFMKLVSDASKPLPSTIKAKVAALADVSK